MNRRFVASRDKAEASWRKDCVILLSALTISIGSLQVAMSTAATVIPDYHGSQSKDLLLVTKPEPC